jgi:metal-dependent HD superfamily phosphatase/phosphodiesterase
MKFPPEIQFYEDAHLLVYRPRGLLNEASVSKIINVIEDLEAKLKEPFNRFFDTLEHDEVELNFRYVINVSLCRRLSYAGHPPIKSAILATDSTMIHYAKLHALLTQGSPIHVRIFKDRQEAAEWLRAPIELLAPKGAGGETT